MSGKISKTKKQLIDVARELFASRGKKNITMNDIAEASNKGRRTLYTYFKNKDEVYKEVVDYELKIVSEALSQNAKSSATPYSKLKDHIVIHLESIKKSVTRNGTLRADFFKDIYEVERSRRKLDMNELAIIRSILDEGVENGDFRKMDTDIIAIIILYALKGLEVPYIRQNISSAFDKNRNDIIEFIFKGIKEI